MTHDTPPPEWKNMTDWSDLPHVYVTKAECQQGMFWRIEACSVPMAIGPEVRLITASEAEAMVAAALREAAELVADDHVSDAILNLADNHAAAALDKLIAEAEARGRKITGVPDRDGRMICVGDHIRIRLEDKWTKVEYWHPEYEVIFQAPNFTLKHIGGGKDSPTARFYFNVPQPNSIKAIETILVANGATP